MTSYKTRRELKTEAKGLLQGNWTSAVLLNIIPNILVFVAFAIALSVIVIAFKDVGFSAPMDYGYTDGGDGGGGTSTASGLVSTLITIGISFTLLEWYRNPERTIHPIKDAFQVFSRRYFLGAFLIWLLTSIFTFLWSLLLIIPGIIKGLAYSQAYFIFKDLSDTPQEGKATALDCIRKSQRLMKGHKARYFVLNLSFVGWYILGIVTLGIAFIWITPYINTTLAIFYDDLAKGQFQDESSQLNSEEWVSESEEIN